MASEAATKVSGVVKSGFSAALTAFLEYDTPKIVHIKSKTVGIINRIIQLLILAYIIGYAIVWQKGYQEFDEPVTLALTKVKGVTFSTYGDENRTWDVADYVIPPEESDACFVTTNTIITRNQTQETCAEDISMPNVKCNESTPFNTTCIAGEPVVTGNGVRTGYCVPYDELGNYTCEIYAWCPVEKDDPPKPALLRDTETFTVLIKNWVEFPKFKAKRRNIIDDINDKEYLKKCRYRPDHPIDQFCPIFELGVIAREAGVTDYEKLALSGGVLSINIHWVCNLDFAISKCVPKYTFSRLDDEDAKIAPGWNFRYANYYSEAGVAKRDLIKAYGIRITIAVTGQAGRFSFVPLLLNFGAGVGLLAMATVVCDIIVMHILKRGYFYKDQKYLMVYDPEDEGERYSINTLRSDDERGVTNRGTREYGTLED